MEKRLQPDQTVRLNSAVFIPVLLFLLSVIGCAGSGTFFQRSNDVASQFEKGVILPDHRYYEGGPAAKPNALAAIHTDYELNSEHWREIGNPTSDSLASLVKKVRFVSGAEYKEKMYSNGARIIGPDGQVIGVWYSVYAYSQVRYMEDNGVYLSFPPAHLPSNVRIPTWEGSERHY